MRETWPRRERERGGGWVKRGKDGEKREREEGEEGRRKKEGIC